MAEINRNLEEKKQTGKTKQFWLIFGKYGILIF
jgi:hypothetical protein